MRRKIFVTGSGGMVGHYVERVFTGCDLVLTDIDGDYIRLDIRDRGETERMINEAGPQVVLHLAAATDVDKCEEDQKWAYECNRDGTRNVAMACKKCGAVMVYISSGSVFSGKLNRPARETDEPDPVNVYGLSKLAGEKAVAETLRDFYIIRAGWMMGGGPGKDKKFIGKVMKKILAGDKTLRLTSDRFGSPVYAKDLLRGIRRLLGSERGLYHMVNESAGRCSRYDITASIKKILNKEDLAIEAVSSGEFELAAPRAFSEELENHRLKAEKLDFMRPWQEALEEYLYLEWI